MHGADHSIDLRENALLAPYAMRSRDSRGRVHAEPPHPYRGPYQRDRDRILHSAAFRRLSGKTQVFTGHTGDYHRTRLTHTMEVASIARTLGRALGLNEDLIEALALLHDIGHPPFGHAGEDALDECLTGDGGFSHNRFALTLVTEIETPYSQFPGLNLTREVLDSQEHRADKSLEPALLEAQIVDLSDSITYDAHDVDDAIKLKLLPIEELGQVGLVADSLAGPVQQYGPLDGERLRRALVHELIDCQVNDILGQATAALAEYPTALPARIGPSDTMAEKKRELEAFLYENVYRHPRIMAVRRDAQGRLQEMFAHLAKEPGLMPLPYQNRAGQVGPRLAARDYLAGMTDNFCMAEYQRLFGRPPTVLNLDLNG